MAVWSGGLWEIVAAFRGLFRTPSGWTSSPGSQGDFLRALDGQQLLRYPSCTYEVNAHGFARVCVLRVSCDVARALWCMWLRCMLQRLCGSLPLTQRS